MKSNKKSMAGFVKSQWKPQLLHGLLLRGVPHLLDKPRVQKGEPRQLARLSGQRIRFHTFPAPTNRAAPAPVLG